jgi:hypothetical protein
MEPVETTERYGYTARIEYDNDPESPREWDNLGTIITWHRRYAFGDRDGYREGIDPGELYNELKSEGALILPIYMYEHSGITIRTSDFADPWDSGQVGFIYVDRAKILEEYNAKRVTTSVRERALACLKAEVEVLDQFLTGDIYGYIIEDAGGDHIDSCWGYYGLTTVREELNAALEALPHTLPLPELA